MDQSLADKILAEQLHPSCLKPSRQRLCGQPLTLRRHPGPFPGTFDPV